MRFSRIENLVAATAIGVGALALAGSTNATALLAGTGWQADQVPVANAPSTASPVTFTVGAGKTDIFSLSDATAAGDVFTVTINGLITAMSTLSNYPTPFDNTLGPAAATFGPAWLNSAFGHLQLTFAPGSYSLSITDNKGPAAFGDRLDLLSAVPEPATWAVMLLGFGAIGSSIRSTRRRQRPSATLA